MIKAIYFDMDGTIADLYAVNGWLEMLRALDPTPYEQAKPLVNMSRLARYIHKAQRMGVEVGIVSWLSKEPDPEYDLAVIEAKKAWLKAHLPSVTFDEIAIVAHGTPKSEVVSNATFGVLFDDEERNRMEWVGEAFTPEEIFKFFKNM